jgi:hypothetical protein
LPRKWIFHWWSSREKSTKNFISHFSVVHTVASIPVTSKFVFTRQHLALLLHDLDLCRAAAPKSMICPASGVFSGDLPLNTPQKNLFSLSVEYFLLESPTR